eukprot:jgi/Tetstr1/447760/TSEL_035093.t1
MSIRGSSRASGGSASSSTAGSSSRNGAAASPAVWVLIADDSSAIQVALKRLVRTVGKNILGVAPQVQCVGDGDDAVKALEKRQYALVLMDIHMPRMGGVQATREIRKRYNSEELPILAVTADSDPDYLLCQGFNGLMEKPVMAPSILPLLQRFLLPTPAAAPISPTGSGALPHPPTPPRTPATTTTPTIPVLESAASGLSGTSSGGLAGAAEALTLGVERVLHSSNNDSSNATSAGSPLPVSAGTS